MSGKQITHAVQAFNAGLQRKTKHQIRTAAELAEMNAALDDIRGEQVAEGAWLRQAEAQQFEDEMEQRRRWM